MNTIFQYQQGGDISKFFIKNRQFEPAAAPQEKTATKKSTSSEKSEGNSNIKELLSLVKSLDGLPIDNNLVTNQIKQLYLQNTLFDDGDLDSSDLISTYLSALRSIRLAAFNKEEYDEAKKEVRTNGGYNECAIDQNGNLYVRDIETGEINNVSPEQYHQMDQTKYQVLTNSNLLYLRANDPSYAMNNSLLNIVSNGIGEEKITKLLLQVINNLGTTSVLRGTYPQAAKTIENGVEVLEKTENNIVKYEELSTTQQQQVEATLRYLWSALPQNAKAFLKYKSKDGTDESAVQLMAELAFSRTSSKTTMKDSAGKSGKSGSSKGGDKEDVHDKSNWYVNLINQEGATSEGTFVLNQGTKFSMRVDGAVYSSLRDQEGNVVGKSRLEDLLNEGLSGIVSNLSGISFGNHILTQSDFKNIMYDGMGGIVVDLPIKKQHGVDVMDFDILEEYNQIRKKYDEQRNGVENLELLGRLLVDGGLGDLVDENGLPDRRFFKRFLIVSAYGIDRDKKFYKKTGSDEANLFLEDQTTDLSDEDVNEIVSTLATDSKKSNYKYDSKNWIETNNPESWWNTYEHIYKGNLYIPLTDNENAAHDAAKESIPRYLTDQYEKAYQINQKRKSAGIADGDVLNL